MNVDTGDIYKTKEEALRAGVPEDRIVEGSEIVIKTLSQKIKEYNEVLLPRRKRIKY